MNHRYLDKIRSDKKVSIAQLEAIGISKSKYYRWRDGEAELTIAEFNRLRVLLNLNFVETSLLMEEQIYIANFWECFDTQKLYTPTSLISLSSAITQVDFYPQYTLDERLAILRKIKENIFVQNEYVLLLNLIDYFIAYLVGSVDAMKSQLNLIYQELMRRDVWTEFEILILTANTGTQSRKRFKHLEEHLERSFTLDKNNIETVGLITSIRFSFYMDALIHYETEDILKITEKINHAQSGGILSQLVMAKRFIKITNELILGGKHSQAKEEIAFFIKAYEYTSEGEFNWNSYFNEVWKVDKKWRKKLKVDEFFNLLQEK